MSYNPNEQRAHLAGLAHAMAVGVDLPGLNGFGERGRVAAFTHEPKAPEVPETRPKQRYFISTKVFDDYDARWIGGIVCVYRNAARDVADVDLRCNTGRVDLQASARLTPAELRELAGRLLDAAHDIETQPAKVEA